MCTSHVVIWRKKNSAIARLISIFPASSCLANCWDHSIRWDPAWNWHGTFFPSLNFHYARQVLGMSMKLLKAVHQLDDAVVQSTQLDVDWSDLDLRFQCRHLFEEESHRAWALMAIFQQLQSFLYALQPFSQSAFKASEVGFQSTQSIFHSFDPRFKPKSSSQTWLTCRAIKS